MLTASNICRCSSVGTERGSDPSPILLQRRHPIAMQRRHLLGGLVGTALLPILKGGDQASAAEDRRQETDAADSPYIQELLRKTEEFKEQRRKERLAAYDRKNFREYFAFESSSLEVAKARGISEETYYAIQKWMADNDKAKPVR